jgi:hypothetical protein
MVRLNWSAEASLRFGLTATLPGLMLHSAMTRSHAAWICGMAWIMLSLRSDESILHPRSRMDMLPSHTLWTWERREDLSAIDPATTAVASLDRTLTLVGPSIHTALQRNALRLPADRRLRRITVVRIETFAPELTEATARAMANMLLRSVVETRGASAFQIDFDARQSERAWYRAVLEYVRAGMPREMPLSITALASWCSHDRWMAGLPIDEAVPMYFRMEPGTRNANDTSMKVRDPLCTDAVGVSTRERWPQNVRGKRVYLFADGGWHHDDPQKVLKELP